MLEPYIHAKDLVAAKSAVEQFETLLSQFGGRNEHARWSALRGKVKVYSPESVMKRHDIEHMSPAGQSNDLMSDVQHTFNLAQSRVANLQAISTAQKEVFALGDVLYAITVTANGRAADFAARQGVKLEVFVHRAVWLTSM